MDGANCPMLPEDLYLRFLVALAIGLAVGIERGWKQRDEPSGEREVGVRTVAIIALLGFAAGIGVEKFGPAFAATIAVGVIGFIAVTYVVDSMHDGADRGATTEFAAFLTFVLGALAGAGAILPAAIAGAVLVALLSFKTEMHAFLRGVEKFELTAAVKLLLVSVVLLPVLPDRGFGPGGVLNPYELWWAVTVIAALGFAGYAAMRIAGPQRGALFMGLMGGLVSSTGVAVSASRASKTSEEESLPLASAIAVAQAVMFVRTGVLIGVLNARLIEQTIVPLALGAMTATAAALFVAWRASKSAKASKFDTGSPDTLAPAVQFIVVVAIALLLAHYAQQFFGDVGVIVSGLISGAVDVDAATVSASRISGGQVHEASIGAAAGSIGVALVANTIVKGAIAYTLGSRRLAWHAIAALAASAIAVLIGLAVTFMMLSQ